MERGPDIIRRRCERSGLPNVSWRELATTVAAMACTRPPRADWPLTGDFTTAGAYGSYQKQLPIPARRSSTRSLHAQPEN